MIDQQTAKLRFPVFGQMPHRCNFTAVEDHLAIFRCHWHHTRICVPRDVVPTAVTTSREGRNAARKHQPERPRDLLQRHNVKRAEFECRM